MAAPSTSYLYNAKATFPCETTDAAGNLLATYDSYIASYIYGTADIKALFYLDAIYEVEHIDVDGVTVLAKGFLGVVYNDPTSGNYKHHAAARRFHLQFDNTTDAEVFLNNWIILNDGGLNTLGHCDTATCTNKQSGAHSFQAVFKSAYYVTTDNHYIRVKRIVGGVTNFNKVVQFGTLAQNTTVTKTGTPDGAIFDFTAGDYIEMQSFNENAEGTWSSGITSFIVEPRQYSAQFNSQYASYAVNNTNGTTTVTIYVNNWKINNGAVMYTDLAMTTNATPGYYYIGTKWYKVEADLELGSVVTDQDVAGEYRQGDPAWVPPYETKVWDHYETLIQGSAAGCIKYDNSQTLTPATTYKNINNNKYYATTTAAIDAGTAGYTADGYYYEISGGLMSWIEIQNGVQTASGSC